ncbi:6-phosphofructokinase [Siculibacillus lacustris]|uniref:Pyrophosphate--fructose 6-phosphate 1-phosphotransferase n=1 Tax=Siculibacillus lacustris TaxID=1549641 RepID=A0A4Q9VRN3_9HYPH|nr:6-phosphofructokinase [Siculibacillus lacustris]TBW38432.1 6-phosphofructokinase [Siculibacillus lacustris]
MSYNKILVSLGGGPTAVINQSIVGVVLEARKCHQIDQIYGSMRGARGIIDEDFSDLTSETRQNLELVANTPSSALGATRDRPDHKYCMEMLRVIKAHEIGGFYYIGGNESTETVEIIAREARRTNYDLCCIHIPKTIDNDIACNDHTPGFPSAARFVAQAFMSVNLESRALPGVRLVVVMGRNAGFLTAASALGKKYPDDGPHLIYLPERPFVLDDFLAEVRSIHAEKGRCVVAISEGIRDAAGRSIVEDLAARAVAAGGHPAAPGTLADLLAHEVRSQLGIAEVSGLTLGYAQRSFVGCVSDVDQHEAREVGEKAVQYGVRGRLDGSVTIRRRGFYSVDYGLVPLADVGGRTRTMDDAFIAPSNTGVTDAFRFYLRPLLGSGMPDMYLLRPNRVPKREAAAAPTQDTAPAPRLCS